MWKGAHVPMSPLSKKNEIEGELEAAYCNCTWWSVGKKGTSTTTYIQILKLLCVHFVWSEFPIYDFNKCFL
jgi:hypothetical protein